MIRYITLIALSICTIAGSWLVSWHLYSVETEQISYQFDREVSKIVDSLEQELVKHRATLRHWKSFFEASDEMNARAFSAIANDALRVYPSIQMVAWSPRVASADKDAFEKLQKESWSQFRIFDINADLVQAAATGDKGLMREALAKIKVNGGVYQASKNRSHYYPFTLIEPVKDKGYLLGADLLSVNKSASDMQMQLSSQTNDVVALPVFPSPFTPENEPIFLAMIPIYSEDIRYGIELKGFVTAAVEVQSLLVGALNNNVDDINFVLLDETGDQGMTNLFNQGSLDLEHANLEKRAVLPVFGRQWSILASPSDNFAEVRRSPLPWVVAAIGTCLSAIVVAYMILLQRRNLVVRQLVEKRTRELREANKELGEMNKKLEEMSRTDGLTQVANRRHFNEVLNAEWRKAIRTGKPLAVIIMDVDFFKKYNDHYGHVAGDECLQGVAAGLAASFTRAGDLVARYGGEEFAVILPNTGSDVAQVAERARSAIANLNIPHEKSDAAEYVSVSVGVSSVIPTEELKQDALLESADQGLYLAKENGRNRVVYHAFTEHKEEDLDLDLDLTGDL